MKTIKLTQGKVALVDDADFESVNAHNWYALKAKHTCYAVRNIRKPDGKMTLQSIHRFLLPNIPRIDHEDGNGLNNQRHNLRAATQRQNHQGFQGKMIGATSKFRGVCWCKRARKWESQIKVNGQKIFLGYFAVEKDAALAYDAAARKYFREFAYPNFKN